MKKEDLEKIYTENNLKTVMAKISYLITNFKVEFIFSDKGTDQDLLDLENYVLENL